MQWKKMMIEIGENLRHERYEFEELLNSTLKIRDISQQIIEVDIREIETVEIVGVKSNSGYSGTMEWGMSNPTFILPVNFFYNIINLFKKKNDTAYLKVTLTDGKEFIVTGTEKIYKKLQKSLNR